eukprot:gnl/TRDRNA2_/TRDRNA2_185653_c0_seq1.p1 gnl/TRDRNA2_/TRDRNA2_185653_c0~~gnl/TRDRNA2_/TRDRNA2_185653_c0_seq1.p1  ORF type:complete len:322 (+),score=43.57 gnl/TRDRNA2_/TRDRNA2_185653_c0_seq1:43-966(+)
MALDASVDHRSFVDTSTIMYAILPGVRSLQRRAIETASTFFSSDGSTSDDPLVVVARRNATAACKFIRVVNLFSIISSAFFAFVGCTFLAFYRPECGGCHRPLRLWLLVFSMLQISQLPTRIVFLMKVQNAERLQQDMQASLASITASPAWRLSKKVSLLTYAWLVLGIVWVINAGDCTSCTGMYWLTVTMVWQAAARAVLTLGIFTASFPNYDNQVAVEAPQRKAALPEQIAALPCIKHRHGLFSEGEASCAVCLDQFAEGDCLRQLPCNHHFHRRCIDRWLKRSQCCPLCMGCIDVVKVDRTKGD